MTTSDVGTVDTVRRRRRWTEEEKAWIVAECEAPGSSASIVARRHDLNANMLFTWRRQLRQRPCGTGEVSLVPAVITPKEATVDQLAAMPRERQPGLERSSAPRPTGRIEIVLGESRRIIVDEDVTAAALARVIDVLERR
jgi:transposase